MHSDQEAIKKSVRSYMVVGALLLVFTGVTVAANAFHLAVPAAITLALVIASIKGTMVASVFMHLSQRRSGSRGAVADRLFFACCSLPLLTVSAASASTGAPVAPQSPPDDKRCALHIVFISASACRGLFARPR
jgi:cytochrome c oxidase subunit 4